MSVCVYVLACRTPRHIYVGVAHDLRERLAQHRGERFLSGSEFVRRHGFERVLWKRWYGPRWKALEMETAIVEWLSLEPSWVVAGGIWPA